MWRGFLGGVLGAVAVVTFLGSLGMTQAEEGIPKEIRARSFVVVDEDGNRRCYLGSVDREDDKAMGLAVSGTDEIPRVFVGLRRVRESAKKGWLAANGLSVADGQTKRLFLGVGGLLKAGKNPSPFPSLAVYDEEGAPRLTGFYDQETGETVLTIVRRNGETLWKAP